VRYALSPYLNVRHPLGQDICGACAKIPHTFHALAFRRFCGALSLVTGRIWVRLLPKLTGACKRVDICFFPPGDLITDLMQLAMMAAAERDGEFVAHFETDGSGLGKAQMVRVRWLTPANQAGLGCDELQMSSVAQPSGCANGKLTLVDARLSPIGDVRRQRRRGD